MTFESTWNPNNYIPAKALGLTQSHVTPHSFQCRRLKGGKPSGTLPAISNDIASERAEPTAQGSPDAFFNDVFE